MPEPEPEPEPPKEPEFAIFPEAAQALDIFFLVQTQWREGFSGRTGLDYTAVVRVIELYVRQTAEQRQTLEMINALESGCMMELAEWRKRKEAEDKLKNKG
jgi:hypothetical protein